MFMLLLSVQLAACEIISWRLVSSTGILMKKAT